MPPRGVQVCPTDSYWYVLSVGMHTYVGSKIKCICTCIFPDLNNICISTALSTAITFCVVHTTMRFLSGIAAISLLWEARGASLSSPSYPLDGDESFPHSPPRRDKVVPLRRGELEGRNDEIAHEMQTLSIEFSSHRGGSFGSDRSPVMSRFPLPADQARSFKAGEP